MRPSSVRISAFAAIATAILAVAICAAPRVARACATCEVGDPTLNVMGVEQPYSGRTRIALELRHFSESSGTAHESRIDAREQRLSLAISHSPTPRLTFALRAPLVFRHLSYANLATETVVAPGDVTARVRFVLFRDRELAPTKLLWAHAGLQMPTAPIRTSSDGPLPLERQVGSGSWDPSFALGGSLFADPLSVHGSVLLFVPTHGFAHSRQGTHVRGTLLGQYQPWSFLGFQLGVLGRYEAPTVEQAVDDPNSGGFVGYLSGGLVGSPLMDVVTWLTVTVPVIEALEGEQDEGVQVLFGVTIDA